MTKVKSITRIAYKQVPTGVKSVDVEYYLSTSTTELSGGSWQTTAPDWVEGRYMWSRTKVEMTDGSITYSEPACIGGTGRGIKSIQEQYYLSTSNSTLSGGSWANSPQTWVDGKYMWTRSVIIYTDNSTVTTDPVCVTGAKGDKGDRGYTGPIIRISEWAAGTKYYQGADGELYQDVVIYNGVYYLCETTHTSVSGATPYTIVAAGGTTWSVTTQYKFVATKGIFIGSGNTGWIAEAGRIYHTSGLIELQADGTIKTSNGAFSVDKYGNLVATSGTFKGTVKADDGYIGGFSLDSNWLKAEGTNYAALISAATFALYASGFDMGDGTINSCFEVHPYAVAYSFFYIMQRLVSAITPLSGATDYSVANRANILQYLNASGQKKATYGREGVPYGGNFATWCEGGMFAGLRPHLRHISSATTLANTDHTVIVNNSSSMTITLPASPEIGQEYEIWHTTSESLTVQTQNSGIRKYIYRLTSSSSYSYSHKSTSKEIFRFKFAHGLYYNSSNEGGMWLMVFYGKNA